MWPHPDVVGQSTGQHRRHLYWANVHYLRNVHVFYDRVYLPDGDGDDDGAVVDAADELQQQRGANDAELAFDSGGDC